MPTNTLKRTIVFACLFTLAFSLHSPAQNFEAPVNPKLSSKEDFVKYEKDVINAAKWLESKPVGTEMEKRGTVNAFVLQWLTGSPTVSVEIGAFHMKLLDKNPQFVGLFMASYGRYCLENNYSKDVLKATTAGIKSVINCYNLGGEVKKNKLLEKAIAADKEGKLEDWVKGNMDSK